MTTQTSSGRSTSSRPTSPTSWSSRYYTARNASPFWGMPDSSPRIVGAWRRELHVAAAPAAIGLSADLPRADADAWREAAATSVGQAAPVQPPQRDNDGSGPWRGSWESRRG